MLKERSDGRVKIFLADPPGSVLHSYIQSGGKLTERKGGSITEGIGQGRVTDNLKPDIDLVDDSLHIPDEASIAMVYKVLHEDGLYLGASSALNVVAAQNMAARLGRGSTVVTILCDAAYRCAALYAFKCTLTDARAATRRGCLAKSGSRAKVSSALFRPSCSDMRACHRMRMYVVPMLYPLHLRHADGGDP